MIKERQQKILGHFEKHSKWDISFMYEVIFPFDNVLYFKTWSFSNKGNKEYCDDKFICTTIEDFLEYLDLDNYFFSNSTFIKGDKIEIQNASKLQNYHSNFGHDIVEPGYYIMECVCPGQPGNFLLEVYVDPDSLSEEYFTVEKCIVNYTLFDSSKDEFLSKEEILKRHFILENSDSLIFQYEQNHNAKLISKDKKLKFHTDKLTGNKLTYSLETRKLTEKEKENMELYKKYIILEK